MNGMTEIIMALATGVWYIILGIGALFVILFAIIVVGIFMDAVKGGKR
jgi:hypothetical protein